MEVGLQCYKPDYIAEYLMHVSVIHELSHSVVYMQCIAAIMSTQRENVVNTFLSK